MMNRRRHKRVEVEFWASLSRPLAGTITCDMQDMSVSGVSIKLDEDLKFFVMMELDVKIRDEGWDESMLGLPARVICIDYRDIGLRLIDSCEDIWAPPKDDLNSSADNQHPLLNFANNDEWGEFGELVQIFNQLLKRLSRSSSEEYKNPHVNNQYDDDYH